LPCYDSTRSSKLKPSLLHSYTSHLQLRQHSLSTRNADLTRALLVLGVDNLTIIKYHSPAPIAIAHTRIPAIVLAKERFSVAEEQDLIALDAIDLAPRIHHPAVVGRNGRDNVDALVGEGLAVLDVWGQVECLATAWVLLVFGGGRVGMGCILPGSEGAGDGEEDDFLVRPLFAGVVFLGTAAGSRVGISDGSISGSFMLVVYCSISQSQVRHQVHTRT
jgi:hypothetical protein